MTTQRPPREQQNHGGTMNDEQFRGVRPQGRPVSTHYIIEETVKECQILPSDLYGKGRHFRSCAARGLATMLMREMTTLSYPDIAIKLNRPNHSSVITAHERVKRQVQIGLAIGPEWDRLDARLAYVNVRTRVLARHEEEQRDA